MRLPTIALMLIAGLIGAGVVFAFMRVRTPPPVNVTCACPSPTVAQLPAPSVDATSGRPAVASTRKPLPVAQDFVEPRSVPFTDVAPSRASSPRFSAASTPQDSPASSSNAQPNAQVDALSAELATIRDQLAEERARKADAEEANDAQRGARDQAVNALINSQQQMVSGDIDGVADAISKASAVVGPNARADLAAAKVALDNEDLNRARGLMLQAITDSQREH